MDNEFNAFLFGIAFVLCVLLLLGGVFYEGYKYGQSRTIVIEEVSNETD